MTKPLNESTVRGLKRKYEDALKEKKKTVSVEDIENNPEALQIHALPAKKRGRPVALGEDLDQQLQAYVCALRSAGAVVNTAIVRAAARGIVSSTNRFQLYEFGGHLTLSKEWGKSVLRRMGFVKRKANTKVKLSVEDFQKKDIFLADIKAIVTMEEVPPELVLNWDQTGVNIVPASSWTMDRRGSKRVEIGGLDDKRQITAVFAASLIGDFLPMQLVYQGKTDAYHPSYKFPPEWDITHTANHWSKEDTMERYLENIIVPHIMKKREELKLGWDFPALMIFDCFKG